MKLYATTTSERATKGQGGNKKIEVSFTIQNPITKEYQPFGMVSIIWNGAYYIMYLPNGEEIIKDDF